MFGLKAKVKKLRDALIAGLSSKAQDVHVKAHGKLSPIDAARIAVLLDFVDILQNLVVDVKDDE